MDNLTRGNVFNAPKNSLNPHYKGHGREILKENIEFDYLLHDHKFSKDIITEILELMLETLDKNTTEVRNIKSYLLTTFTTPHRT